MFSPYPNGTICLITYLFQTIEFNVEVFLPFLPIAVPELLQLIAEADTMETKRRILGTLNVVIERAGTHVSSSLLNLP